MNPFPFAVTAVVGCLVAALMLYAAVQSFMGDNKIVGGFCVIIAVVVLCFAVAMIEEAFQAYRLSKFPGVTPTPLRNNQDGHSILTYPVRPAVHIGPLT